MSLVGQTAIVTGGAGGIGAAIVRALATAGAHVAVADLDLSNAKGLASDVEDGVDSRVVAVELDVTSRESIGSAMAETEERLGPIHVLVNNAAIDKIEPFIESSEETWDRLIRTNLKGTISCTRAVLDGMLERESGSIVNIASDAGKVGSSGEVVYSATKGGVIAFTKALAREVARHGVRVNCVCPGPTDTPLLAQVAEANPKLHEGLSRAIPLRRIAVPDDIAPMVRFLADSDGSYLTGQAISVSGGLTMS